jgi:hypothetical protein
MFFSERRRKVNNQKERYCAVVESGSCSPNYKRWEERNHCGHAHKTIKTAQKCGEKHMGAHYYVDGSWRCFALWYDFKIHNQLGERV